MANLLNSAVMTGLMSATSHADKSQHATGISAKNRGDEGAVQGAMAYASLYRGKSMTAAEQAQDALAERVEEVREEERLEQEQRLEGNREEIAVGVSPVPEAGPTAAPAMEHAPQPAAIFEPSQEYLDSMQVGAATETVRTEPAAPAAKPVDAMKPSVAEVGVYTSNLSKSIPQTKAATRGGSRSSSSRN